MKTLLILCVEPNFAPIRTQSFPLLTISTFESRTLKSGSLATGTYFTGNRKGQGNTILASSLTKVIVKITTPIYFSNTLGIPLVLRTHNLVNWFLRAYSFLTGFVKKIKAATHLTVFPFRTIQINDIIKQKLVSFHKTQINRSLETGATQRRFLVVETTETCNHCQTAPSQLAVNQIDDESCAAKN